MNRLCRYILLLSVSLLVFSCTEKEPEGDNVTVPVPTGETLDAHLNVVQHLVPDDLSAEFSVQSGAGHETSSSMFATVSFRLMYSNITSIMIESVGGEPLSGDFTVLLTDGAPIAEVRETGAGYMRLLPDKSSSFPSGNYSFAVLPGQHPEGVRFTLTRNNDTRVGVSVKSSVTSFKAGKEVALGSLDESLSWEAPQDLVVAFEMFNAAGGAQWPFSSPLKEDMSFSADTPSLVGQTGEFILTDGGYRFGVYSAGGISFNTGSKYGMRLHGTGTADSSGDHIMFPAPDGLYLTKVEIVSGIAGEVRAPSVTNADGTETLKGGQRMIGSITEKGGSYVWNLSGTQPGEQYRLSFGYTESMACLRSLRLTFTRFPGDQSYEDQQTYYEACEDEIPDFSRVGYKWGDMEIPQHKVVATLEAPADGADATAMIQEAIDAVRGRGTILLKAGTYNIASGIHINRNGVVLKGEGAGTILRATGVREPEKDALITVGLTGTVRQNVSVSSSEIMTTRLAVGQMRVPVRESWKFAAGDRVIIWRPATANWIHDLKMDQIPQNSSNTTEQWTPGTFNLSWERTVMDVQGDYVYLDNPVVMETSLEYGGGYLIRSSWERISECGVEDMYLDTEFNEEEVDSKGRWCDEDHAWTAVLVRAAEHCWVRNVTSEHFGFATVHLSKGSKNITVENCHGRMPVSRIEGSRRYAFQMNGAQLCIVKDCTCEHDRHGFVTSHNATCGPNVFLRCSATNMFGDLGPHVKWSTGILYDNVTTDSYYIAVQDRHHAGTGHGWAGVNHVLYNCTAPGIICQNPWVTGKNYAIGCIGVKTAHNRTGPGVDASFSRPDGVWIDHGAHVTPQSLYESTLEKRHADGIYIAK